MKSTVEKVNALQDLLKVKMVDVEAEKEKTDALIAIVNKESADAQVEADAAAVQEAETIAGPMSIYLEERSEKWEEIERQAAMTDYELLSYISGYSQEDIAASRKLKNIIRDVQRFRPVISNFQVRFDRVNPNYLNQALSQEPFRESLSPACPSDLATRAMLYALRLARLEPLGTKFFRSRARDVADNRVIAGANYPSDSKAGFWLAFIAHKQIEAADEFQAFGDDPLTREEFEKQLSMYSELYRIHFE